jgi:hypothetical protein
MDTKHIPIIYIIGGVLAIVLLAVVGGRGGGGSSQVIRADPNRLAAASSDYQASLKARTELSAIQAATDQKQLDTLLGYAVNKGDVSLGMHKIDVDGYNVGQKISADYQLGSGQIAAARELGLAQVDSNNRGLVLDNNRDIRQIDSNERKNRNDNETAKYNNDRNAAASDYKVGMEFFPNLLKSVFGLFGL